MRYLFVLALIFATTASASAQSTAVAPALAGVGFLVGSWGNGAGKVAETGGTSRGSSTFEPEAGGAALLRKDRTELYGANGERTGSFEQIMLIYPEGGTLHADYTDGTHVIHYVSALVDAGRSVTFTSAAAAGAPTFRLRYELVKPGTLAVVFAMAPPGQTTFTTIAAGTLERTP